MLVAIRLDWNRFNFPVAISQRRKTIVIKRVENYNLEITFINQDVMGLQMNVEPRNTL